MILSVAKRTSILLTGLLPIDMNNFDKVSKDSKSAQGLYLQKMQQETGKDRLYMMFSIDEFGNISPELNAVFQSSFLGLLTGAVYGGFIRSRVAYMEFMERNQATTFKSHLDAKKKLQDKVTISFARGAFQWGWRLALFSASYVLITTTISSYRGKSSFVEYITAGGLTGAVYKANLGLRGVIVGGGLGCVLGGICGGISLLLLKASGMSMEEVRYWQYQWKESRDRRESEMFKEIAAQEESALTKHHDEKVGDAGKSLDNI